MCKESIPKATGADLLKLIYNMMAQVTITFLCTPGAIG